MADWIAKYWLQTLFGVVCSSMGAMFAWAKGKFKKQKAIEEGLRAVLHDRIYQAHAFYINQKWISSSDLKNIEYLYNAYHTLGGNGTGTTLYEEMHELPHIKPREKQGGKND